MGKISINTESSLKDKLGFVGFGASSSQNNSSWPSSTRVQYLYISSGTPYSTIQKEAKENKASFPFEQSLITLIEKGAQSDQSGASHWWCWNGWGNYIFIKWIVDFIKSKNLVGNIQNINTIRLRYEDATHIHIEEFLVETKSGEWWYVNKGNSEKRSSINPTFPSTSDITKPFPINSSEKVSEIRMFKNGTTSYDKLTFVETYTLPYNLKQYNHPEFGLITRTGFTGYPGSPQGLFNRSTNDGSKSHLQSTSLQHCRTTSREVSIIHPDPMFKLRNNIDVCKLELSTFRVDSGGSHGWYQRTSVSSGGGVYNMRLYLRIRNGRAEYKMSRGTWRNNGGDRASGGISASSTWRSFPMNSWKRINYVYITNGRGYHGHLRVKSDGELRMRFTHQTTFGTETENWDAFDISISNDINRWG